MRKVKKEDQLLKNPPPEPKATRKGLPVLLGKLRTYVESMGPGVYAGWSGMYGDSPQGETSPLQQPATGFPFRTAAAAQVWLCIQQVYKISPTSPITELIKSGVDKAGVNMIELTPEDSKLLELATNWLVTARTSNMARANANPAPREIDQGSTEGHELGRRGYP